MKTLRTADRGLMVKALLALTIVCVAPVQAQQTRWWQPEFRLDAISASAMTYHVGFGVSTPMGNYVRLGFVGGGGVSIGHGGGFVTGLDMEPSGRVDLIGRFLLDPFRQSRLGPYAGAGVSWLSASGSTDQTYVVIVLGLEGNPGPRFVPAFELGLGGGARVGLIMRRSVRDRR